MIDEKRHVDPPSDPSRTVTYEFDLTNGALVWGEGLYSLFGFDRAEPAGTHEWWANHVHPGDAMVLNETMDMLMYPWVKEWTVDYRFEKADNSYVMIHDRATVVRDDDGKALRLLGVMWLT